MREEFIEEIAGVKITCDVCSKTHRFSAATHAFSYLRLKICKICGRDICSDCFISTDSSFIYGSYSGESPEYFCKGCWETGEIERDEIFEIRNKAEEDEERLLENWYSKCTMITNGKNRAERVYDESQE